MTQLLKIKFNKTARKTYQVLPSLFVRSLCLSGLFLLIAFTQHACAEAKDSSRIIKWKDDKGATHYGDKIPAQYANGENSVINQQGITVKRNKPISYQDKTLDLAKQEQDKKDNALSSAFTNENEIDLARDRNLQLDQVSVEGLQLQKSNSMGRLAENKKSADGFIKRKKPIPAYLSAEIETNQAEIAKQDLQITASKAVMENTRKRFDNDKKRYIALKNHTYENNALSETTP